MLHIITFYTHKKKRETTQDKTMALLQLQNKGQNNMKKFGLLMIIATFSSVRAFVSMRAFSSSSRGPLSFFSSSSSSQQRMVASPIDVSSSSHDNNVQQPRLLDPLVVCGPSGVGKGTIITKFMEEYSNKRLFRFSVSHTTRQPRNGEINGTHYHFVTLEHMNNLMTQQENYFLETAEVHGNYYGTSWQTIIQGTTTGEKGGQQQQRCLLDVDVQGVQRLKSLEGKRIKEEEEGTTDNSPTQNHFLKPRYIFIAPPTLQVLQERLMGRGSESTETLQRRLHNAKEEVDYGLEKGNFDTIIINDNLNQAVKDFTKAVNELYNIK